MAHLDGDLGLVVRGGGGSGIMSSLFGADSAGSQQLQLQSVLIASQGLEMAGFPGLLSSNTKSKSDLDSGKTSWSGASSPSSVLPSNPHLMVNDPKFLYRTEAEKLTDVFHSFPNYGNQNFGPVFHTFPQSGTNSKEAPRIGPFPTASQVTDIDRLVPNLVPMERSAEFETLSRNFQRRDQQQQQQQARKVTPTVTNRMQSLESSVTDMLSSMSRLRRTPRAGPGLGESAGGRQMSKVVSQETIQEDFFQGRYPLFTQKSSSGQCGGPGNGAESISSEPLSASETSRHSSPGRDEPCVKRARGPVKKVEHSQSPVVKVEDSLDVPSPGGPGKTPKRRKNQQKRVVCVPVAQSGRPTSESLPSDLWAWRKYGQKPIKGSPYPRGYYRCSTSKGCTARKQVERSRTDPSMLIITYTADHDHPWRSNRSTLPGSARLTPGLDHNAGATGSHQIDTIEEENPTDLEGSLGSSPPSPELGAADESSASTAELMEAQVSDLSDIDNMMEQQVPGDLLDPTVFMSSEDGMMGDSESFHLSSHTCIGITGIPEQDDLFAELGELPESHYLFGKLAFAEDRPDDECGQLLGMDNQSDAFNLFAWDSATTGVPSRPM